MTIQSQVLTFRSPDYQIFAGLDVNKHSIAVTFCNHEGLRQSLRLPECSRQLLNHVRQHFPEQRLALIYAAGPTGFGRHDEFGGEGRAYFPG